MNAYQWAKEKLGSRDRIKLERNTYLERVSASARYFEVILHETAILKITPMWVELNSGGWHTMTTADRMRKYGPVDVVAMRSQGWHVFLTSSDLDCWCVSDENRQGHTGCHVIGEYAPGLSLHWAEMWQLPNGECVRELGEWAGSADVHPVYIYQTCPHCQGTAKRTGPDWSSGGYPYFDGIRVSTDGSRLMVRQPNRPKAWQPIITKSGWTGQHLARSGGRSSRAW